MVASRIPRTDLPFSPQDEVVMAARYPDALRMVWTDEFLNDIVSLHVPMPPENVFDFPIGLRMVVNLFDYSGVCTVMMCAKPHPGTEFYRHYVAGRITPLQMLEVIHGSHRNICPKPPVNMKYHRTSSSGRISFLHPLPDSWPQPKKIES